MITLPPCPVPFPRTPEEPESPLEQTQIGSEGEGRPSAIRREFKRQAAGCDGSGGRTKEKEEEDPLNIPLKDAWQRRRKRKRRTDADDLPSKTTTTEGG